MVTIKHENLIQHWIGILRYKKKTKQTYLLIVHTQQNEIIVNSYINTKHLKDNVDQKSLSYLC